MTTIYEELKKDHETVRGLLRKLEIAELPEDREGLVTQVRDALVPHSRAEEAVLYNVLRDLDAGQGLISHAYQEHVKAEALLRALQVTELVHLKWKDGVRKLREELEKHIAEEEGKVFSAAKAKFSQQDALELGQAFVELKPKLAAGVLSSQWELITNIMPKPFRKSFADSLRSHDSQQAS